MLKGEIIYVIIVHKELTSTARGLVKVLPKVNERLWLVDEEGLFAVNLNEVVFIVVIPESQFPLQLAPTLLKVTSLGKLTLT